MVVVGGVESQLGENAADVAAAVIVLIAVLAGIVVAVAAGAASSPSAVLQVTSHNTHCQAWIITLRLRPPSASVAECGHIRATGQRVHPSSWSRVREYGLEVVGEQWVGDRPFTAAGAAADDPGGGERVERAPGGLRLDLAVCGRLVREAGEHPERSRPEAAGVVEAVRVPGSFCGHGHPGSRARRL